MDVMDDIHERLNETERRAGEVVSRLEQVDSLQRLIADAGRGLDDANANVVNLAAATRIAVESLNETLVAFREAIAVIRRSDPAPVRESLARIETEIGRIDAKLAVVEKLESEFQNTRITIVQAVESNLSETKKVVEDAVERLSRQTIFDRIFGRYR